MRSSDLSNTLPLVLTSFLSEGLRYTDFCLNRTSELQFCKLFSVPIKTDKSVCQCGRNKRFEKVVQLRQIKRISQFCQYGRYFGDIDRDKYYNRYIIKHI